MVSKEFKSSARMQSFLSYVVNEALAGRTEDIRAKTIAMDVYGYDADDLAKREGVVRVDAGRVRRKLKAYYSGAGTTDAVIISLPVGSYAPEFQPGGSLQKNRKGHLIAAITVVAILGVVGYLTASRFVSGTSVAERSPSTIYDVSPTRVEAMNLCSAGRDLIFPVVDLSRLRPALLVFETAIERDPLYFCGYAGAAQVETMLAVLQFGQAASDELFVSSDANSAYALELAPDAPWALSARAWFEFGKGNYSRAKSLSSRATDIAPDDPHVAEFDALISLYTSDFDRVLSHAQRYRTLAEDGGSTVAGNALAAAQFHTGNYGAAIQTFEDTIADGGPFGPISTAYLMAAHWNKGELSEARRLAEVYGNTWPEFPLAAVKHRVFADPAPVQQLIAAMRAAGWAGNDATDGQ